MSIWKQLPFDEPTNLSIVWVRIKYYYGKPFQAEWNSGTKEFTSVTNSIIYPAYTVSRWKNI